MVGFAISKENVRSSFETARKVVNNPMTANHRKSFVDTTVI